MMIVWKWDKEVEVWLFSKYGKYGMKIGGENDGNIQKLYKNQIKNNNIINNNTTKNSIKQFNPASHTTIILQFLHQNNISFQKLLQNQFSFIISNLKSSKKSNLRKQLSYNHENNDLINEDNITMKQYMKEYFAEKLTVKVVVKNENNVVNGDKEGKQRNFSMYYPGEKQVSLFVYSILQLSHAKQIYQNPSQHLFLKIFTYPSIQYHSLILIYQNNKLMHRKQLKISQKINKIINNSHNFHNSNNFHNYQQQFHPSIYQFHLSKHTQTNLTFTQVIPNQFLLEHVKNIVKEAKTMRNKRKQPVGGFDIIGNNIKVINGNNECYENSQRSQKKIIMENKVVNKNTQYEQYRNYGEVELECEDFSVQKVYQNELDAEEFTSKQ